MGPATSGLGGGAASMVLTGTRGYLLAPDRMLYSGPVNGQRALAAGGKQIPCPVGQPLADGQPTGALLAAANTANLVLACASSSAPGTQQAKQVFTSADGGMTWQNAGAAPSLGLATSVAATPDGTYVLATGPGHRRAAGRERDLAGGDAERAGAGRRVRVRGHDDRRAGHRAARDPAAGTVWFTFDGGKTWRAVPRQLARGPRVLRLSGFSGFSGRKSPLVRRSPRSRSKISFS